MSMSRIFGLSLYLFILPENPCFISLQQRIEMHVPNWYQLQHVTRHVCCQSIKFNCDNCLIQTGPIKAQSIQSYGSPVLLKYIPYISFQPFLLFNFSLERLKLSSFCPNYFLQTHLFNFSTFDHKLQSIHFFPSRKNPISLKIGSCNHGLFCINCFGLRKV